MNHSPSDFPAFALPGLLRDVLEEAAANIQAPLPILGSALLTAASIATQGLADVRRPNGLSGPVSLMFLTIAESGERKTACDDTFTEAIREFERKEMAEARTAMAAYEAELLAWEERSGTLKAAITKAVRKDGSMTASTTAELKALLAQHLLAKPQPPRALQTLIQDITPEALIDRATNRCPLLALISDEGGKLLNGHLGRSLPLINSMRDGSAQYVDRKSTGQTFLGFVRLTAHLQSQPKTLEDFLSNKGNLARDNGFLARTGVIYPYSNQGFRAIIATDELQWPMVAIFNKRITELLKETKEFHKGRPEALPQIKFSPQAALAWVDYFNFIEINQRPSCPYSSIRDAASKNPEFVARIAAVMHRFTNQVGDISLGTLQGAISVGRWYLESFKAVFDTPSIPQSNFDAQSLDGWLWKHYRTTGEYIFRKNFVRQYGPLRSKAELDAALASLVAWGRITWYRPNKTWLIGLCLPQSISHGHT